MNYFERQISAAMCAVSVMLYLTASTFVAAQDRDEKISVDTNLVLINILVRDKNGQTVSGLKAEQFEVFDDIAKRPIESFSSEEALVSFGVIYDMHPTTSDRTKSVIESLGQFKRELRAGDDVFLVAFNMGGQQTFDFIPTFEQLEKHMAGPEKREPYSLYDAIYFASERIQSSRNRKRVLLIISDSADHRSRHTFAQLREKLADVKSETYAVIFDADNYLGYSDITHSGRELRPSSKDASALDRAAIQGLTLKSGGGTYFGGSLNSEQLFSIYKRIAGEIRAHYTLGFYPDAIDEKIHNIRVGLKGVKGMKDFTLEYRSTYRNLARMVVK
ncbi:MAG: VWA domain-containing protein [Pyrinomonadaceae bacterium]